MGLFNNLFNNLNSDTSQDYRNSFSAVNQRLKQQDELGGLYTGNLGYLNNINQGLTGANVISGAAGQNAQKAARNTGMSKAAAAAIGANQAANSYNNNFANQQGMAQSYGNAALSNNLNMANMYANQANTSLNEQNARYNRATNNLNTLGNIVGNLGGLFTSLSDERCKERKERIDHLSQLIENIPAYKYEYTDEAQEGYPKETDNKEHVGIMAQDLEKNPVTAAAVKTDENGIKHIDGSQLSTTNLALIADLANRLSQLEEHTA